MKLELPALFKSMYDGTIADFEETAEEERINEGEIERFNFTLRASRAESAEELAGKVVRHFHAKSMGAKHVPYSPSVSKVIIFRADFRAIITILSEDRFVSVIAHRQN